MSKGGPDVVDLTQTPDRKPTPRQVEVVVLDDSGPGGSQAETVVSETVNSAPPAPRPLPRQPELRVRLKQCKFGQRCRKLHDSFHLARFAHNHVAAVSPQSLTLPPNLFGGGAQGHQRFVEERRRQLEREEQQLVQTIAKSLEEERAAAERQKLREAQDAEYRKSVRQDRKTIDREKAKKRQKIKETIALDDAVQLDEEEEFQNVSKTTPKYAALSDEPNVSEPDCVSVTFQLPNGKRITRRFRRNMSTEQLYAFIHHANNESFDTQMFSVVELRNGVVSPIDLTIDNVAKNDSRILLFVQLQLE